MKKSFTLVELIIVILLSSTVYYLAFSSFSSSSEKKYKVDIINIKKFMLENFAYENSLSLTCLEDENLSCYIFVDGNLSKDINLGDLFKSIPEVYHYDKDLTKYEFSKVRLDDIEYSVFFELIFNTDRKHQSIIVDTLEEDVYLFSSISNVIMKFKNTNEIIEDFFNKEIEVKDAL